MELEASTAPEGGNEASQEAPAAAAPAAASPEAAPKRSRPRSGRGRCLPGWLRDKRTLAAFLFIMGVLAVGTWLSVEQERLKLVAYRANVQNLADSYALELSRQLRVVVSTTLAVGALGAAQGEALNAETFASIAGSLRDFYAGVSELQFSPYGKIAFVEPNNPENTKPGLSLFHHELLRHGARATVLNYPDKIAALVGPQPIVGGGMAVILRHPIFTTFASEYLELNETYADPDSQIEYEALDCATPSEREDNCRFPGPEKGTFFYAFATALTRLDEMLAPIGLERLDGGKHFINGGSRFHWQLRITEGWHPALNETGGIFATSAGAPPNASLPQPVTANITIDEIGVSWSIAIEPAEGWSSDSTSFTLQLVLVAALTVLGGAGMAFAVVGSVREAWQQRVLLTEQQAAATLEASSQEAAKLARSRLIRTVMHDLRSPLVSVDNVARTLRGMASDGSERKLEEVVPLLDALGNCSALMENIVSDMLDFERIEAGRLTLLYAPLQPRELTEGVRAVFESTASAKGVELIAPFPEGLAARATLLADAKRLQQCLNNGLSNAIKFTQPGKTVRVTLGLEPHPSLEGWAVLLCSVVDEGIGLNQDELASLAEDSMFTQVGRGQMQGNGGTGLGLPIVRQMLRLHNDSTLALSSDGHGKGSTFTMRVNCQQLELAPPHAAAAASASAAAAAQPGVAPAEAGGAAPSAAGRDALRLRDISADAPSLPQQPSAAPSPGRPAERSFPRGYRVLHVEDDAFVRLTLPLQTFDVLGLPYEQAEDGAQALERVRAAPPGEYDCVVLDNQMPVMGGADTARALRACGYGGLLLGVTGDPLGCDERKAFEASGVDEVLDKDSAGVVALLRRIEAHGARLFVDAHARAQREAEMAERLPLSPAGARPVSADSGAFGASLPRFGSRLSAASQVRCSGEPPVARLDSDSTANSGSFALRRPAGCQSAEPAGRSSFSSGTTRAGPRALTAELPSRLSSSRLTRGLSKRTPPAGSSARIVPSADEPSPAPRSSAARSGAAGGDEGEQRQPSSSPLHPEMLAL